MRMNRWVMTVAAVLLAFAAPVVYAQQVPQSRAEISMSFAPIVRDTAPSVVNVYAKRIVQSQQRGSPFGADPFFRRFFGDELFGGRPRQRAQNSLGSGVIVDSSGIVVTNNHVIGEGTEIRVVLNDNREYDAELILKDERTDLAVLRIKPEDGDLVPLPLGDSDAIEVGDLVLAIGNPFGVGQTVTSGIVSALARTRVGVSSYQFFIQTDAAINPGNSGGALVDMNGRLIGINTAIFSRSGGSNGIGFAIPVNMVRSVIEQSLSGATRVVRPWVGADLQDVTADLAGALGLDRPKGSLVANLHPKSPLKAAGMRQGDVIVKLDDRDLANAQEFNFRLATLGIGKTAKVVFQRKSKLYSAELNLAAAPEDPPRNATTIGGRSPFTGLEVMNISPAVADELGLPTSATGVVVSDPGNSIGRRYGFNRGDVIVELNDHQPASVKELEFALNDRLGYWDVAIMRKGRLIRRSFGG
jgi:Do/DeqQ family serine protease